MIVNKPYGRALTAFLLFTLTIPVTASAEPSVELSANIGVASDYRFRGISLSDRAPALQGGVDATIYSNWFLGAWASSIADYEGADVELDVYAGRTGDVAGMSYSLSAYGYLYPGGRDVDYVEFQALLGRDVGPVTIEAEASFVPKQWNSSISNLYLGGKLTLPIAETGCSLTVRGGRENGFYSDKLDWEVGLTFERDWLSASAAIVGSNFSGPSEAGADAKTAIVAQLTASF